MERLQITPLAPIVLAGLLAAIPAERACAGDWKLTAGGSETLTLTDNVNLSPPGQKESDAVLGVSAPLGLRREGSRVKFQADYTPTVYLYARTRESDNLQNNLHSFLTVEAVDKFLFVDATANIYQSYISPLAPRPDSGASNTQNRTQQTTLGLSPYIRHESSMGWSYLVRNDNFWNTYSASGLANSTTSRLSADIKSPPARLRYGFDYNYLYSRDESQPTANYQQLAMVRPILTITPRLNVSARLGYETNDYVTSYSGLVYGAGTDWAPSPRTKLDGYLEHRFFGPSYGLNFNHRTRMTAWRLGATRSTYTTLEQPLTLRPGTTAEVLDDAFRSRIPDPQQRDQAVKEFLARAGLPPALTQPYTFYTNQTYVAQQWTASVGLLGKRNTAELTLFWQENEPIASSGAAPPGGFASFSRFRQQGVTLTLSHRLTALSNATLAASRLTSLTVPSVPVTTPQSQSVLNTVRVSVTHQLSPTSDGSIGVRWANFDSVDSPYRELAILAVLTHRF